MKQLANTKRLWLDWSPESPLFFRPRQGSDEYKNHSIYFTVLGLRVVFFYERNLNPRKGWYCTGTGPEGDRWHHNSFKGYVVLPKSEEVEAWFNEETCCPPDPIPTLEMIDLIREKTAKIEYWD